MSTGVRYAMCVLATLLQSGLSQTAMQQAGQVIEQDEELEEIFVTGARVARNERALLNWLKRLVGQYSYEGYVELGGEGAPPGRRMAHGGGKCIAVGVAVVCEARVLWPDIKAEDGSELAGGVSTLSPATTMYGVDGRIRAIRSMQVDGLGLANGGPGELHGDTLITTTACVDIPGDCKRVSRVSAQPDGKLIRIEIETLRDAIRIVHYVFQLQRLADEPATDKATSQARGGAAVRQQCKVALVAMLLIPGMVDAVRAEPRVQLAMRTSKPKTPEERRMQAMREMELWLRQLVGRYYQFERITINGSLENYYKDGRMPDGTVATRYVDCIGIGSGPGVLCNWYSVVQKPGKEVGFVLNMLVQFGLDPNASEIRILVTGGAGSIGESSTVLTGDTAWWAGMSCNSLPIGRCERTMKISIPADGRYVFWAHGSRITSAGRTRAGSSPAYLYRLPPDEDNARDGLPRLEAAPTFNIELQRFAHPQGPR